jgi:hypothetical protein
MPSLFQKMTQQLKKNKKNNKIKSESTFTEVEEKISPNTKKETKEDHIEVSTNIANKFWNDIKKRVRDDPKFVEMTDNEKIEIYQKSEFKEFYIEFPIVSRYMICMGQFSNKAFNKYLIKCKNASHDPVKSREKGYTEDQWVQRQSDYVRYLWESYQRQHYSQSESKNIWNHAYTTLKKEFQDFKDLHEDIEQKLKNDEKVNKNQMTKELLTRLANNEQSLDETTSKNLLASLQTKVNEQRKKNLISSINNSVPKIPPSCETRGSRKELKPAK